MKHSDFTIALLYFFAICYGPDPCEAYQTLVKHDFKANINLLRT